MSVYIQLILEFLKIGLFTIGGGLATLPFLQELTVKYPWFSASELIDMIAISESTPGPIGINMATFAGFQAGGILGGILASVCVVLPGMILILLVARILDKVKGNPTVDAAFKGIRPAVAALIIVSGWEIIQSAFFKTGNLSFSNLFSMINIPAIIWFVIVYYALVKFNKHPIIYLLVSALVGIFIAF